MEELEVKNDLTYEEYPIKILETAGALQGARQSECAKYNGGTT